MPFHTYEDAKQVLRKEHVSNTAFNKFTISVLKRLCETLRLETAADNPRKADYIKTLLHYVGRLLECSTSLTLVAVRI